MNFTQKFMLEPNNKFGAQNVNGQWTGLVGMLNRAEADFSMTPLSKLVYLFICVFYI